MRVTIPDPIVLPLEAHATPSRSIDDLATLAVQRIGHVSPNARFCVLTEDQLNQLETRLGRKLPINSFADLYEAVDTLADVKLGSISFGFTPSQLKEIQDRAQREGCSPDHIVERILYAMIPQFFAIAPVEPPVLQRARK